jgi:hypothetical protein
MPTVGSYPPATIPPSPNDTVLGTQTGKTVNFTIGSIAATAPSGTVTSVGLAAPAEFTVSGSPVVNNGVLTFAKAAQAPNLVWAGPATGATNGAPTFRALNGTDMPNPSATTQGGVMSKVAVAGQFLTGIGTDGSVSAAAVTSANVSGLGTFATQNYATPPTIGGTTPAPITGTQVTATGAINAPNGSAASPGFQFVPTNMGFYSDGTNIFGSIGGAQIFEVQAAGLTITRVGAVTLQALRLDATLANGVQVGNLTFSGPNANGTQITTWAGVFGFARITTAGAEVGTLNFETRHGGNAIVDFAIDSGILYAGAVSGNNKIADAVGNLFGNTVTVDADGTATNPSLTWANLNGGLYTDETYLNLALAGKQAFGFQTNGLLVNTYGILSAITLQRNDATLAAPNNVGGIWFTSPNSAGTTKNWGVVAGYANNVTPGSEVGQVYFQTLHTGGSTPITDFSISNGSFYQGSSGTGKLIADSGGNVTGQTITVTANGSAAAPSLTWNSLNGGLFTDATNLFLSLGGAIGYTFTPLGGFGITTTGNQGAITLHRTDTLAGAANVGSISGTAPNSAGVNKTWAAIGLYAQTPTSGSEVGNIYFQTQHGGSSVTDFTMQGGSLYAGTASSGKQLADAAGNLTGVTVTATSAGTAAAPSLGVGPAGNGIGLYSATQLLGFSNSPTATQPVNLVGNSILAFGTTAAGIRVGTANTNLAALQVLAANTYAGLNISRWDNSNTSAIISIGKSRATTVGTPGGAVTSGTNIGAIQFAADDGTTINTIAAQIWAQCNGAVSAGVVPSALIFTTQQGANDFCMSAGSLYAGGSVAGKLLLDGVYSYANPAPTWQRLASGTGFNVVASNNMGGIQFTPAGTLATGTLTMPSAPVDQQEWGLGSSQAITALTMNAAAGQTLAGALTTIAKDGFARWKYFLATTTWYRIG